MGRPRVALQPIHAVRSVLRQPVVATLATDPELPTQLSHAGVVLRPAHHELEALLHGRRFLPGHEPSSGPHGRCYPCARSILLPMRSARTDRSPFPSGTPTGLTSAATTTGL